MELPIPSGVEIKDFEKVDTKDEIVEFMSKYSRLFGRIYMVRDKEGIPSNTELDISLRDVYTVE